MSGLFLHFLQKIVKIFCCNESIKCIFYVFAQAGADIVAPSDMMDGRILAIKQVFTSLHLLNQFNPPSLSRLLPTTATATESPCSATR